MTVQHNGARDVFGDKTIVSSSSSSVANAAFSVDADTDEWVNYNSFDVATAILTFTPSATTTIGDSVKLYASRNLVNGADSESFPSTTNKQKLLGEFFVATSAAIQTVAIDILLDNCVDRQGFEFAIENLLTTVSMDAGWTLEITPKSKG